MDFLGPVVQVILFFWDPIFRQIGCIKNLNDNMGTLEKETDELKQTRDQVQRDVEHAVSVGKLRVSQVDNWLQDVGNFATTVESIRSELDERRTCLMGCCTRYKLGKKVVEKIEYAKDLRGKGVFDKVAVSPKRTTVLKKQVSFPSETQNTFERKLEEIWQCLHNDKNSIICVYGMGGIGKTTLMAAIEERFSGTKGFRVIWVTVSKDFRLELIQQSIARQLDIKFEPNEDDEGKKSRIFSRLENIRYLLILDDLWEAFRLDNVGIPKPNNQNGCKIAITTRSIEVCSDMEADEKIQVSVLTDEEAWSLFKEKAGQVVDQFGIYTLAKEVVKECRGLPLAIKVVGAAMKEKNKKELWEKTLSALRSSAISEIRGMESKVFVPLKYSYDCLHPKLKSFFLYCSVFPEDYNILIEELVRYWAFEPEWVNNTNTLRETLNTGHGIIESLKDACLLEGSEKGGKYVRMHDLIRDLAIWIACSRLSSSSSSSSSSCQPTKFLIKAAQGLQHPPEEKFWERVEKISLMQNKIEKLQIKPRCSNLVTLLLQGNDKLGFIHDDFFENMPKLQILDLSGSALKSLPASLSELKNLQVLICRCCYALEEIPTVKNLEKLQVLDLFACPIRKLPEGVADLKKLRQLCLKLGSLTPEFPRDLISGLKYLEDLTLEGYDESECNVTLMEAATLTCLTSLKVCIPNFEHIKFNWDNLTRFEIIIGSSSFYVGCELNSHPYDKVLALFYLGFGLRSQIGGLMRGFDLPGEIDGLMRHVEVLLVSHCKVTHLMALIREAQSIRVIGVANCDVVDCIIDWSKVRVGALNWLEELRLEDLSHLKVVFKCGPLLQQLRKITISNCPKLKYVFSFGMVEYLLQLQELRVENCYRMVAIIEAGRGAENLFPRLTTIVLDFLPRLESIGSYPLVFTSLKHVTVDGCRRLKKLPILSSAIQSIQGEITGSREWWEGILEWKLNDDDEVHSKSIYSTIYVEEPAVESPSSPSSGSEECIERQVNMQVLSQIHAF